MVNDYSWDTDFSKLFARCLDRYRDGDRDFQSYYGKDDLAFLYSIGYRPREFFDFVEDFGSEGTPSPTTAVLIAAVRRDYFVSVQKGVPSGAVLRPDDLPGRQEAWGGFLWLPRIVAKARGKLRGELDPDIMYSCGGDRSFLSEHGIHPADFLRLVWAAGDNQEAIVSFVAAHAGVPS